jgi:hypothetical protein
MTPLPEVVAEVLALVVAAVGVVALVRALVLIAT